VQHGSGPNPPNEPPETLLCLNDRFLECLKGGVNNRFSVTSRVRRGKRGARAWEVFPLGGFATYGGQPFVCEALASRRVWRPPPHVVRAAGSKPSCKPLENAGRGHETCTWKATKGPLPALCLPPYQEHRFVARAPPIADPAMGTEEIPCVLSSPGQAYT
jgi:hypothetical protein